MTDRPPAIGEAAATSALLDCVIDAIIVLDERLRLSYANRAASELIDLTDIPGDGRPASATALIHPDDLQLALDAIERAITDGRSTHRFRLQGTRDALPGVDLPVEAHLSNHLETPGIEGVVVSFRDLRHEHALEASLERLRELDQNILAALTDDLTGLPLRRLFLDRLEACLRRCERDAVPVTLFFVDLDAFKTINDALGHTAGDAMLRSTTARLLGTHPTVEHWGRIGGDEFVLFVEDCDHDRAAPLAMQLSESMRQAMVLAGRSFYSSASIGVAVIDTPGVSAESAVRRADIAMYEGKRGGRNAITMFASEMERSVIVRTELEGQLRRALIGAGPDVVYQPIVDLQSGRVLAVEALARWYSPTQGPIAPDRFVAMAEEMGIADQLDRHVVRKASRALAEHTDPTTDAPIGLTVNASPMHLDQRDFATTVLGLVADAGFDPRRLVVEVTESIAVQHASILGDQLRELRSAGVRIALDDFGTGHSSLAQLEFLPVDLVKIDRTFLLGVPESPRRLRFVETIIQLADALQLAIVFEGIETPEQARVLADLGVTYGQGYLLAKPMGLAELYEGLARSRDNARAALRTPTRDDARR